MILDHVDQPHPSDRETQRIELATVTSRLIKEFSQQIPPGSVIRCVARCRESLSGIGVAAGLVPAVEGMARLLLVNRLPLRRL